MGHSPRPRQSPPLGRMRPRQSSDKVPRRSLAFALRHRVQRENWIIAIQNSTTIDDKSPLHSESARNRVEEANRRRTLALWPDFDSSVSLICRYLGYF